RRAGTALTMVLVSLVCVGGCGQDEVERTPNGAGIVRTAKRGPVALTLTVTPAHVDFPQRATVELEILAEKGVTITEDEYERVMREGDHRFEYRLTRSERKPAEPTDDGKLRWFYRYELEFFLPGEYELPAAEVSFVDGRAASDDLSEDSGGGVLAEAQTLATEPLTITVRPPEGSPLSVEELRNITTLDPVDLPRQWSRWWWVAPLLALVILIAAVAVLRRQRLRRAEAGVQIPAHEWARQQLAALVAEDLLAKGRAQEFYYRISAIVRGYIERRFGVCAPEMTTEEFLTAAADDSRFGRNVTGELDRFLTACDLVKYARHEPGSEESDAVLKAAGDFVERTLDRITTPRSAGGADRPTMEERAA
ncbi:MAG: hypothetical protein WBE26_03550, partial [Phycisphaerae bacterium]